jgi:hypothetical protein
MACTDAASQFTLPYAHIAYGLRRISGLPTVYLCCEPETNKLVLFGASVSLHNLMLFYAMLRPLHLVFIDTQKVKQIFLSAHHFTVKRTTRLQRPFACHNCMKQCGSNLVARGVFCTFEEAFVT